MTATPPTSPSTTLLRTLVARLPHLRGRGLADLVRANRARRAGVTLGRALREARKRGATQEPTE